MIVICTTAIPIVNLILFIYQSGAHSNAVAKNVIKSTNLDDVWAQIAIKNAGRGN